MTDSKWPVVCRHEIPNDFQAEEFIDGENVRRCSAYLLVYGRQCRTQVKRFSKYCGYHGEPLIRTRCALCKKERVARERVNSERRKARRAEYRKANPVRKSPSTEHRLTAAEQTQIENQRERRRAYDAQLTEAISILDEHLKNSTAGREFDRGLKLALDGDVAAGLEIMKSARERMNAQSFDDSALLALLEKPEYLLEASGAFSMGTVLDVMGDYMALALKVIPAATDISWLTGKLRDKFGSSINH